MPCPEETLPSRLAAPVVLGMRPLTLPSLTLGDHCPDGPCNSISGLVVEYIVAIDVTRVRFPADACIALLHFFPVEGRPSVFPRPAFMVNLEAADSILSWPRGVTVSTLDSESSDRGSNPREAFLQTIS